MPSVASCQCVLHIRVFFLHFHFVIYSAKLLPRLSKLIVELLEYRRERAGRASGSPRLRILRNQSGGYCSGATAAIRDWQGLRRETSAQHTDTHLIHSRSKPARRSLLDPRQPSWVLQKQKKKTENEPSTLHSYTRVVF